jgi:hypothetical protein
MSEFCYEQQKLNPTRFVTRFIMNDRIIHTDYNCAMEMFYQFAQYKHSNEQRTIARFKIHKYK